MQGRFAVKVHFLSEKWPESGNFKENCANFFGNFLSGFQMKPLGKRVPKIPTMTGESDRTMRFGHGIATLYVLTLSKGGVMALEAGSRVSVTSQAAGVAHVQLRRQHTVEWEEVVASGKKK